MKVARADFSAATIRLLAERAGYQCSFPTCNKRTIGPGATDDEVIRSGIAGHIHSASPGGPRGQGGHTEQELIQPSNGIHLCSDHAKIVDSNDGRRYSAETLLRYKAIQEARVAREHQGLYSPIGWVHDLTVTRGPVFAPNQSFVLGKMNLIYGNNATGKTAIAEWLAGMFGQPLDRWSNPVTAELRVRVSYVDPDPKTIAFELREDRKVLFEVNGVPQPFNPIQVRIIAPTLLRADRPSDDLNMMSAILHTNDATTLALADEINRFPHAQVHNVKFVKSRDRHPIEADDERTEEQLDEMVLVADVEGTVPGLSFRALSSREQERMVIEFATGMARVSGREAPTILILADVVGILFEGWFKYYAHHFLDAGNRFQTLLCLANLEGHSLDSIRDQGWTVVQTNGRPPSVTISQ